MPTEEVNDEPQDTPTNEPEGGQEPDNTPDDETKELYKEFFEEFGTDKKIFDKAKDEGAETPSDDDDTTDEDDESTDDDDRTLEDVKEETQTALEFEEDSPLSDELQAKLSELVEEIEVDDDTLNTTVELMEEATIEGFRAAREEQDEKIQERIAQLKKDPLFSSTNKDTTFKNMDKAIQVFGGKDAKTLEKTLSEPGAMDISLVRFLNQIGSALNEQPEFGGKTVDMKSNKKPSKDEAELNMAKKQYGMFF